VKYSPPASPGGDYRSLKSVANLLQAAISGSILGFKQKRVVVVNKGIP
jgi:hypothetical protein